MITIIGFTGLTLLFPMAHTILRVIILRSAQGFFIAFWWVGMEVQIADLGTTMQRGTVMGRYNASWATGFLFGPFISGYILETYGFKPTFYIAAISMIILAPVLFLKSYTSELPPIQEDILELDTENQSQFRMRSLIPAWITVIVCGGFLGLIMGLYPVYASSLQISAFRIGTILLVYGAARILTFLSTGILIARFGEWVILLGGFMLLPSIILIGLYTNISVHIVILGILGFGLSLAYTSALTMCSKAPKNMRGRSLGIFESGFAVGIALMSQIGGIIADWKGLHVPYIFGGLIAIITIIGLTFFYLTSKKSDIAVLKT